MIKTLMVGKRTLRIELPMALKFTWTVSRGNETYGYNIVTLYADGVRVARCNGGGYDMEGTCLGEFVAAAFPERLLALEREYYGLSFHDPDFDPGKAVLERPDLVFGGKPGETVEEREKAGKSIGLERYQAFYQASTKRPDESHHVPLLDGATGLGNMRSILRACNLGLQWIPTQLKNHSIYLLVELLPGEGGGG